MYFITKKYILKVIQIFIFRFLSYRLRHYIRFMMLLMSKFIIIFPFYIIFILIYPHFSHHMPVRLKSSPKVIRSRLQYASWLGNTTALIIISENDIYLKQSPSDEEDVRLTFTGEENTIYNGIADFLYQGK